MRIVMIDELNDEMVLAKEIVDFETGRVLLGVDSSDLLRHVERLRRLGIQYVYVQESFLGNIPVDPVVKEEIRNCAEKALVEIYSKLQCDQNPEYAEVITTVKDLINEVLGNQEISVNVYEMRGTGGDFIGHSVNVAFLSLLIAKTFQYDDDKMRKLGMGAILHDIGVAGMPESLLAKQADFSLDEKLLYEQHPLIGYHMVKDSWQISALSRSVILSHHERSDGSGYPRHLLKGDIHEFSRIVGLADCFEELTGGHPLSAKIGLSQAVEFLSIHADGWFDAELVHKFISRIPVFQTGTTVHLHDGRTAIVIGQNNGFPTRPLLRVLQDNAGNRLDPGVELNLLENNHILIR